MDLKLLIYFFIFLIEYRILALEVLEGCDYESSNEMYYCNGITHTFPNQHYGVYDLRCNDCTISKFTERTFPFSNSLESFNVSHSKIQTISKRAFSQLTFTQFIYLDHNEIKEISEDAFSGVKQLYELHLQHNQLKKLKPRFLNDLGTTSVDLSFNELEEIADNSFKGVIGILVLDLSHNKIETLHRFSFAGLNTLEILELKHNKICFLELGLLSSMSRLKTLNLSNNKLRSMWNFDKGAFSGLKSLTELNLANNSLTEFNGNFLLFLPALHTLDISENGIHKVGFGSTITENSVSLKLLKIDRNIFSCDFLRNLVRYLRKYNIEIISNSESYYVQNINGIACIEWEMNESVPYHKFFTLAQEETKKNKITC